MVERSNFASKAIQTEQIKDIQQAAVDFAVAQDTTEKNFLESTETAVAFPFRQQRKPIEKRSSKSVKEAVKAGDKGERLAPIKPIKDTADQYQGRNPELRSNVLVQLRDLIKPGDSKEQILAKVRAYYPDESLADEVLEFLLETSEGELNQEIQAAKEDLNKDAEQKRRILAGRNIGTDARDAADRANGALGTPSDLRNTYRTLTRDPHKESTELFQDLSSKYAFKELKSVVDFLLHALGSDMKSKGPSIPRGELHRLISETRSLQAILGVYRFYKSRMHLIKSMLERDGLELPANLNFEGISREFMSFVNERYPTSARVLQSASRLGIDQWVETEIAIFSQWREGVREVSPHQIFRSLQHRDEVYMAIIEALEDLEDELDEELKEEEAKQNKTLES